MNKIFIDKYNLKPLNEEEILQLDGGVHWLIPTIIGGAAFICKKVTDNWQCFKDGLMGRQHLEKSCGK